MSSRSLPGEVPASWVKRLSEKAKECEFEHMTSEEALALVMSKYGKVEAASRKRKAIMKNLQTLNKFARLMNFSSIIVPRMFQKNNTNGCNATPSIRYINIKRSWLT